MAEATAGDAGAGRLFVVMGAVSSIATQAAKINAMARQRRAVDAGSGLLSPVQLMSFQTTGISTDMARAAMPIASPANAPVTSPSWRARAVPGKLDYTADALVVVLAARVRAAKQSGGTP
jgi:hypothetical protein